MERAVEDRAALLEFPRNQRELVALLIQAARAEIRADHDTAPARYQASSTISRAD